MTKLHFQIIHASNSPKQTYALLALEILLSFLHNGLPLARARLGAFCSLTRAKTNVGQGAAREWYIGAGRHYRFRS